MKNKNTVKSVIFRIVKDAVPIAHWLIFATVFSIISAILSMTAPELIGSLTNRIYDLANNGIPIEKSEFIKEIIFLALVYVISAVFGVLTTAVMNYSVTNHFTCRMRIRMSEKISKIPVKTVDTTPNGEIISRMTHDVSVMGGSIHNIFSVIINGVIRLAIISFIIFTAKSIESSRNLDSAI